MDADGALRLTSDSDLGVTAYLALHALLAGASGLLCALLRLVVTDPSTASTLLRPGVTHSSGRVSGITDVEHT